MVDGIQHIGLTHSIGSYQAINLGVKTEFPGFEILVID